MLIVDSHVYRISSSELINAMRSDWDINKKIFNSVFRKNSVFQNQILELSFTQAVERTAILLLNLCKQYGTPWKNGFLINIPFTHSDVASMVNTSRVTVNHIFTWLMENNCVKKEGRYFVVLSPEKLKDIACGGQFYKNPQK